MADEQKPLPMDVLSEARRGRSAPHPPARRAPLRRTARAARRRTASRRLTKPCPPRVCTAVSDAPAPPRSQEALKEDHRAYLEAHPEINGMLNDFVSACLAEQPVDVFEFAQTHFAAEKAEKKR